MLTLNFKSIGNRGLLGKISHENSSAGGTPSSRNDGRGRCAGVGRSKTKNIKTSRCLEKPLSVQGMCEEVLSLVLRRLDDLYP